MNPDTKQYSIFQQEIKRRIDAFTRLICSIALGFIISSIIFFSFSFLNLLYSIIISALIIFLLRISFVKSCDSFSQIKILLTRQYLIRNTRKSSEKYLFQDINKINVKRTIKGNIRAIKIGFTNNSSIYINALTNFDQLKNNLINKCSTEIKPKEFKEHINYDHPIFYIILGLLIGLSSNIIFIFFTNLNINNLKIVYYFFIVFNFLGGLFFVLYKPISKSYGNKAKIQDFVFGLLAIVSSIFIYIYIFRMY